MDSFFLLFINLSRSDGQSVIRITLGGGNTFLRFNESHFIPRLLLFILNTQYLSNFDGFSSHFFIFLSSLFLLGVLEYGFKKILDRKKGEGEGYKLPK